MYVWACVVVVERCGEGCGCVSYSRGMCGGVSMRVVGWTRTLYCEHHERYIWTRLPMDLYESMRVRMDGIRAHYGGTATAGCTTGVVFCRRASRGATTTKIWATTEDDATTDGFEVRVCACVVMREPCTACV